MMKATATSSETIIHEAGHMLGLWHVHHGLDEISPCSDANSCRETSDTTSRLDNGDLCSDSECSRVVSAFAACPFSRGVPVDSTAAPSASKSARFEYQDVCYDVNPGANSCGWTMVRGGRAVTVNVPRP